MTQRLQAALRRAAPLLGLGIVLELLAIPAVNDLDSLLRILGYLLFALGAVVALATVFGTGPEVGSEVRPRPRAGRAE